MNATRTAIAAAALLAATAAAASGRITIVSEQDAAQSWQPAPGPRVVAGYPKVADPSEDVCINIGYLIDGEGKTSNFVAMKSWSSSPGKDKEPGTGLEPFVQLAAATVSLRHYAPVGKAKQIYTSSSFAFAGSKALAEEEILSHCRIDDLPAFVAASAKKSGRDHRMATDAQEREHMRNMGSSGY